MLNQLHSATSPSSSSPISFQIAAELRTTLLRQISCEGGFAYITSVEAAASGDLLAAEVAREIAWEQLHSGPWNEVSSTWRDAYAMACLHVASIRVGSGDVEEAMRVLDLGIIMGGELLRKELSDAIKKIKEVKNEKEFDGKIVLECLDNLDMQKVLQVLPKRSLLCHDVEKRSSISLETFICDYFLRNLPVIITDCIDHWPARTKWKDIEYLNNIAGDRTVPVEVGKNYLASDWKQELITFSQFLERSKSTQCSSNLTYLAQHPLFDQIQELHNDIMVPDYCYAGGGELQSLNAWFGPPGTVTPLHHDPHHNMFAQVDLDNLNINEFPRAEKLEFMDCILEEGEMLYIPPKWWHYVRSLSLSFSVSFWWKAAGLPPEAN